MKSADSNVLSRYYHPPNRRSGGDRGEDTLSSPAEWTAPPDGGREVGARQSGNASSLAGMRRGILVSSVSRHGRKNAADGATISHR
ncbi:hypothetical protein LSAT2_014114 [Lamellibrachia satsuma]|nr:hypothetical protein LSAT2_014114 [Lamellibrachia satsuma]